MAQMVAEQKTELLERLKQIGQQADRRAEEIEAQRRLPDDIAQAVIESGVLRLWIAKAYGGFEAPVADLLDAVETLAYHDGATGWVAMVTGTASLTSGFLPPAVGQEIFGHPRAMVGGLAAPMGRAVAVEGGLRVTGKWLWGSGTPFCSHIVGVVQVVDDDGKPTALPNGVRLPLVYFPKASVKLIDTWHVAGLKGTASGEYAVQDLFVPDGFWIGFPPSSPVIDAPLYRFPFAGALAAGVASAARGMARRALDEILELSPNKVPQWATKKLAERPVVQTQVARAEATYFAARAFLREAVANGWAEAEQGTVSVAASRRLRMAATYATEQADAAVEEAYRLG